MSDNSRYADSAQARAIDAGQREAGYDPFHPDAPDYFDRAACEQRQHAYHESRRARLALAMGELEAFFGGGRQ